MRTRALSALTRAPALLAIALPFAAAPGGAQGAAAASEAESAAIAATAAELRDRALADGRSYELVRSLTVEVGPRFAGTPGDRAGVEWALRKMRELGLANVRAEPVTVPRWVRGEERGEIVAPWPQKMVLTALGGSVGTPEEGVEAAVVEVASLEALEALPDDAVAGKIVFFNRRMERRKDGSDYRPTVRPRGAGPAAAAKKGAVAMLLRSVGTGTHRFPHTGATRYDKEVPRIPAAALAVPDADVLEAQLASGEEVRFRLYLGSRYLADTRSSNVIGEVPGRERPEEIVLLGAHLDSWDLGTGAIDDGAGCATMLTVAALLRELPRAPRRTVRVVLFANEEFGLSGARAYAEAHADELERHHLAMESDFGAGRVWRFATAIDPAALPEAEKIAAVLAPLGIEHQGNTAFGGADLIPLREARVPKADLTQDGTYYFDFHHTDDDTLDKIDPQALAQNLAAYAVLAYMAAETPVGFGRAPAPESN